MSSLIQKMFRKALSLDALDEQVDSLEKRVSQLENISDERDSLWLFIEEMQEQEKVAYQHLQDELNDAIVRSMKPQGEA